MTPYSQAFNVDATYRIVNTEEEAEEFPLDEDEVEVIVGSRQFDLVDLIEEELLFPCRSCPSTRCVPKCTRVSSLGAEGTEGEGDEGAWTKLARAASPSGPIRSPRSKVSSGRARATRSTEQLRGSAMRAHWPFGQWRPPGRAVLEFGKFFRSYHGSSAKQEVAVEARHAPFARFPRRQRRWPLSRARVKCICVTTLARTATIVARKSSRRRTTKRTTLIASRVTVLAFRVAIGSLDIFPVRQKGGIQCRFFVSIAVGALALTMIPCRALKFVALHDCKDHDRLHGRRPRPVRDGSRCRQFRSFASRRAPAARRHRKCDPRAAEEVQGRRRTCRR